MNYSFQYFSVIEQTNSNNIPTTIWIHANYIKKTTY